MKSFQEVLQKYEACYEARIWSGSLLERECKNKNINFSNQNRLTIEEAVNSCYRGDWLLWLGKKLNLPLNKMTLAKARCAKTVIHLMKDQRSTNAVNVAERFGLDECTLEELNAAYYAAYAYAAAYAAADAAAAAAYAAAYATADAAYAAAAAAYAAAAYATADAAADARIKNQKQTADICREILGQFIIDEVNRLLNY